MKNKKNSNIISNPYYDKMHRMGSIILSLAIILFFAIPTILCLAYDIMPKFSDLIVAAGGLCVIFIPIGIAETFGEVPVMGSSYNVSLITGNVLNLKLPATLNAFKVADVKQGTEIGDAIAGIAVAVSSLVTLVMLAIGALLLTPLQPLLTAPAVATAANYVLPALFGCLTLGALGKDVGGGIIVHNRLKALIIPFIVCIVLFLILPDMYELLEGFIMILAIGMVYFFTKKMYKKGIITVELPEESSETKAETCAEVENE